MDFRDIQRREVANCGQWLECGCDETVFGIAIDEYFQNIAGTGTFRNGIPRQEDFAEFAAIQK